MTVEQSFRLALQHQEAGRLAQAEAIVRQILTIHPDHPDSLYLLGILAHQANQHAPAVQWIARAAELSPRNPIFPANLGVVLAAAGQIDGAIEAYRRALALQPDLADTHNNLANALREKGQIADAIAEYRHALSLRPNYPQALGNLGNVYRDAGRLEESVDCLRRAEALSPNSPDVLNSLAVTLLAIGRLESAADAARRAIALRPDLAEAHNTLGIAIQRMGDPAAALDHYKRATELRPSSVEFLNNLGIAFQQTGRFDAAIDCFQRALAGKPHSENVLKNLANACKDSGDLDRAIDYFRQAMAADPTNAVIHGDLLYTLHFHPAYSTQALFDEHRIWNERHARPLEPAERPRRDRVSNRRIRIGYVSPDFNQHCQSMFTMPLLAQHDRERFEIICYSDVLRADPVTARLQSHADVWRETVGVSDAALADQIRADRIDILVDLTLHMGRNRLLAFARKPAPVQITWLGYPGTTGLTAMDYRVSDPYLDPPPPGPGGAPSRRDSSYSERTLRLPETFWCYQILDPEPQVAELPALKNGYVTFGCFNNFCKVTPPTLDLWATVLAQVPDSRLSVRVPAGSPRERFAEAMRRRGINGGRIEFTGHRPRWQYMEAHRHIDVCLDTFPYNGHTTTLDSLWMGVPVISLAGETPVSRGGLSILSNVGLAHLATIQAAALPKIAATLCGDPSLLAELRHTLRDRMASSPVMNAKRFTHHLEAAYDSTL